MSAPWQQPPQQPATKGQQSAGRPYDPNAAATPVGASHYYETGGDDFGSAEKGYGFPAGYGGGGKYRGDDTAISDPSSSVEVYPPPPRRYDPYSHPSPPMGGGPSASEDNLASDHKSSKSAPKRPNMSRQDSESWERLLKGAGYSTGKGDQSANSSFVALNGRGQPQNQGSKIHPSIRLFLYILIPTALLWIPGIVALLSYDASPRNDFNRPTVWKVGLFWWSIWLSSIWVGWWICRLGAYLIPQILKHTLGYIGTQLKRKIDYLIVVERYVALFMWTVVLYVVWLVIIIGNFQDPNKTILEQGALAANSTTIINASGSGSAADTSSTGNLMASGSRLWFGFVLSAALLLGEKLFIQSIAYNFHRVSYEDRISTSKFQIKVLTTLYEHSKNLNRKDTYIAAEHEAKRKSSGMHLARVHLKKTGQKAKRAVQTSTSVLGTVASEISGQAILQANNPRSVVVNALNSKKQTTALARRIWYSFVPPGKSEILMDDILHCFPDAATAEAAFEVFDKDLNGDVTKEELESACLEAHRERMALQASMIDVDSAVGRLDSIFMSVFVLIAAVIIAALLSVKFSTLVTSFGTVILGLSWLIGSTAQETLAAILFLFVKHPYDVGDRVDIGDDSYIVKEMRLLTTVFKTTNGKNVMISHAQLAQKPIVNLRRSGPIEETFKFEVSFDTSFQQIEMLRSKMVHWISGEKRDFLPGLDINVVDFQEQSSMLLSTGIRYKSNWQQGGLKAERRNRWLCQFKVFLAECKIYGPSGDPGVAAVKRYAQVPWPIPEESFSASTASENVKKTLGGSERTYRFMDKDASIAGRDAFDDYAPDTAPGTAPPSRPVSPANALEQGRLRSGFPAASAAAAPPYIRGPPQRQGTQESYELMDAPVSANRRPLQ
ncbi:uncharacterized protein PFL1_00149 [Pseudozyma flocculosa PF-1]|uniref:EF-hand domain-containing protein n=1 Tax=Pseudozyma flocculosa TaxID=84751 RepID=A0A5C3EUI5_9BASI|nr:uncharacterized protein PFL1_00149 [Pseudozyma flocculosa PF-1]EPQ31950.1 hypothetical protein PFL1_00149 [Pseudozyma flocculosa PF-1]SPO35137.1 uncharacterized protein PSFLO_00608 [Pseudozyma flocculosa]